MICLSQLYLKLILNVCLLRVRKSLWVPAVNKWDAVQLTADRPMEDGEFSTK